MRGIGRRQRPKQRIDRQARTMRRFRLTDDQSVADDGQRGAGGDDIDPVRDNDGVVGGLGYRHRGVAGEQLDKQAVVRRVEVLDNHEGAAGIGGEAVEQPAARLKTARRGTDRHQRAWCGSRTVERFGRHAERPFGRMIATVALVPRN